MPATKSAKSKKISEKSTKIELWGAYNELMAKVSNEQIEIKDDDSVNNIIDNLSETKININSKIDELTKSLLTDLSNLYKTAEQIKQNKEGALKQFENQKQKLQDSIEETKVKWKLSEKQLEEDFKVKNADIETALQRQEEEYKYNLKITRKRENDDYLADKELREKKIADRESDLLSRKKEIEDMENQIAKMPKLIENEVSEAEKNLSDELTFKFQSQIKELTVSNDHIQKIAEIKIANLEATIKQNSEENASLKTQLSKANEMLKQMAVSAIEAKKPSVSSSNQSNEK